MTLPKIVYLPASCACGHHREGTTQNDRGDSPATRAVQVRVLGIRDEELAAVGVRAAVGHGHDATGGVLQVVPELVGKLVAPHAGAALLCRPPRTSALAGRVPGTRERRTLPVPVGSPPCRVKCRSAADQRGDMQTREHA